MEEIAGVINGVSAESADQIAKAAVDSFKWIELGGVIVYMGILLLIGAMASRKMKDMRDYFAAGKQLSFWSVAFSARATGECQHELGVSVREDHDFRAHRCA